MPRARASRWIAVALLTALASVSAQALDLYVAPTGNDKNPGTKSRPFATLDRARDAILELKAREGLLLEPVVVNLRGGTYFLKEPFVLTPENSGTAKAPIVYAAYRNEHPVVSGGVAITGWKETTLGHRTVWYTPLRDVKSGKWDFHQLWVNGQRRSRGRFPRQGYLRVRACRENPADAKWTDGQTSFQYSDGDIPSSLTLNHAEVIVMNRWVESRLPIIAVDARNQMLRFGRRSVFQLAPGDLYYIENVPEALDTAGTWCLDNSKGMLFYAPLPGESMTRSEIIAPRLSQLVLLERGADPAQPFEFIEFRRISFQHSEWYFPNPSRGEKPSQLVGGFPQAAVDVPAAMSLEGAHQCEITRCEFTHLGTYGIAVGRGSAQVRIVGSTLHDLGAGGIKIGETAIRSDTADQTRYVDVIDSEIGNGGRLFHSAVGVWIGQSYGNSIIHNAIHDFYYTGISVGWTWGYGLALAARNRIEWNRIHHIGVLSDGDGPILSDMGAIYTLGRQPGTIIRYNVIHDIGASQYGGWGIYLDEGSSYIVAEDNWVYRTTHGGFHQHYGRENIVRNNVFAFSRTAQIMRTRPEDHTSFAFEHNIVIWKDGSLLGGNFHGGGFVFDRNVYWHQNSGEIRFDTLTLAGWQSAGNDRHSIIGDPQFVDISHDDFHLRDDSPALSLGFQPIDPGPALRDSSIPDSLLKAQAQPTVHRLLYNSDGTNVFLKRPPITTQDVLQRVDEIAGTGVTTFLISPNVGQAMDYPSKVCAMYTYHPSSPPGSDTTFRKISANLDTLVRRGLDPIGMIIDRCRLRGIEAFITFRMNELHDVDKPGSPLLCDFWKTHPEYRVGGYQGWGASALDYRHREVREYYFRLLQEVCERYDLDGLELDFMRFPYYFPPGSGETRECQAILTDFIHRIRLMTTAIAARRMHPLLLSARVPSSLQACNYVGLDPAEWCENGLVDFITVAPFLSTETAIEVKDFKAVCPGVPVYAGIEYTIGTRMMTPEEICAAAAALYANGADGIYSFNFFCAREDGLEPDFSVFSNIVSPDSLVRKDKLYTKGAPKYPIPRVSLSSQLPFSLEPDQSQSVTLFTPESVRPAKVVLRLESREPIAPGNLRVSYNGTLLGALHRPEEVQLFQREVPYTLPASDHCLEINIDPALIQLFNTVVVTARDPITITWVYEAVHAQGHE